MIHDFVEAHNSRYLTWSCPKIMSSDRTETDLRIYKYWAGSTVIWRHSLFHSFLADLSFNFAVMRFTVPLAICLGVPIVTNALHVPEGTPDGIYDLTESIAGTAVLSKVGDLLDLGLDEAFTSHMIPEDLQKRADPGSYKCYPYTLIRNSIQRAAANLGNTCGECFSSGNICSICPLTQEVLKIPESTFPKKAHRWPWPGMWWFMLATLLDSPEKVVVLPH